MVEDASLGENLNAVYFDAQDFRNFCPKGNFSLFHQNIRSFNHNFDHLAQFIDTLRMQVDVIVLTETWFSEFNKSNITGYNSYHVYISVREERGRSVGICERKSHFEHHHRKFYNY